MLSTFCETGTVRKGDTNENMISFRDLNHCNDKLEQELNRVVELRRKLWIYKQNWFEAAATLLCRQF